MMYKYSIDYVDKYGERQFYDWNCSCNSYDTTLQLAQGCADRLDAKCGAIRIWRVEELTSVKWFDNVLGETSNAEM